MMIILIWFSSLSFLFYGIYYFTSPAMKQEFIRFGLAKFGALTAILEILGAIGLVVGLQEPLVLVIASAGLALLMLLGVGVRIVIKDSLLVSLPAIFFMGLNTYIFYDSLLNY